MSKQVTIIGAGIAGMSAAIALAHKGIAVSLFESRASFSEEGAGIQLSPNATSCLRHWGLLDTIETYALEPEYIILKDLINNKKLLELPIGSVARQQWNAPYLTMHRFDLQNILQNFIHNHPLITLKADHHILSCEKLRDHSYAVHASHKESFITEYASSLVYCDGVWSKMRKNLGEQAQFTQFLVWRTLIKTQDLVSSSFKNEDFNHIHIWLGRDKHFLIYPLKGKNVCNLVFIQKDSRKYTDFSQTMRRSYSSPPFMAETNNWHDSLKYLLSLTGSWTFWPIYAMPSTRFSGREGEFFLGDAAHADLPFAAQGAAMAIEDAAEFAHAFSKPDPLQEQALALFVNKRHDRLKSVMKRSRFNQFAYHSHGLKAYARNFFMQVRPTQYFLTDLNWLYGYDVRL